MKKLKLKKIAVAKLTDDMAQQVRGGENATIISWFTPLCPDNSYYGICDTVQSESCPDHSAPGCDCDPEN